MSRPNGIATALLSLSVLIATLSLPIRSAAVDDWEAQGRADQYANAISIENGWSGRFYTEPFNNAPYIAAWIIAGLLAVCAAIIYAGGQAKQG